MGSVVLEILGGRTNIVSWDLQYGLIRNHKLDPLVRFASDRFIYILVWNLVRPGLQAWPGQYSDPFDPVPSLLCMPYSIIIQLAQAELVSWLIGLRCRIAFFLKLSNDRSGNSSWSICMCIFILFILCEFGEIWSQSEIDLTCDKQRWPPHPSTSPAGMIFDSYTPWRGGVGGYCPKLTNTILFSAVVVPVIVLSVRNEILRLVFTVTMAVIR